MAFWRRKKDEFVSLGLSRAVAEPAPAVEGENEEAIETSPAPSSPAGPANVTDRAPWQTFVLGLDPFN